MRDRRYGHIWSYVERRVPVNILDTQLIEIPNVQEAETEMIERVVIVARPEFAVHYPNQYGYQHRRSELYNRPRDQL